VADEQEQGQVQEQEQEQTQEQEQVEPMEVINSGTKRGVKGANDEFMRFVSDDGVNEYPSVILLLNRIFLRDEDRGGAHVGITKKFNKGDDFTWHKVEGLEGIKACILSLAQSGASREDENQEEGQDEGEDEGQDEEQDPGSGDPSGQQESAGGEQGESFFKEEDNALNVQSFFRSRNLFYIRKEGSLYFSKLSPFDSDAAVFNFPEDGGFTDVPENIIDVYSLTDAFDLILTQSRLYRFSHEEGSVIRVLKVPAATGMCKTKDYLIVSSHNGLYKISKIEGEAGGIKTVHVTHSAGEDAADDGLPGNSRFTFCFSSGDNNIAEVNGQGGNSCLFNFDTGMGQAGNKAGAVRALHNNNEGMLFASGAAYDSKGTVYPVSNALNFHVTSRHTFFIEEYAVEGGGGEEGSGTVAGSRLTAFLNGGGTDKSVSFLFNCRIIACHGSDAATMYLLDEEGRLYKTATDPADLEDVSLCLVCFNYDEWKESGEPAELDVMTVALTFSSYLELLLEGGSGIFGETDSGSGSVDNPDPGSDPGSTGDPDPDSDGKEINFVFMSRKEGEKTVWQAFGDDGRLDDTFKKLTKAFDMG
jgi:hypothetical protein